MALFSRRKTWLAGLAAAGLASVALTASAQADGGTSISGAPVLTPGVTVYGDGNFDGTGPDRRRFWRIDLNAGDQLSVDYTWTGGGGPDSLTLCLLDPTVGDSPRIDSSQCAAIAEAQLGQAQKLIYTAPSTGRWALELWDCVDFCNSERWTYQLTANVKVAVPTPIPTPPSPTDCANYYIIDSRGSGEPANRLSRPAVAFARAFEQRHANQLVQVYTNPYPAPTLWQIIGGVFKILPGYGESVSVGERWLTSKVHALNNQCKQAKLLLTGYSQGADVTATVYQAGGWRNVVGVVLFGDPHFNSADAWADRGDFVRSGKRANGVMGPRPLFGGIGKVLSFCHRNDPVCQKQTNPVKLALYRFKYHDNYGKLEALQAAEYFS